MTAKKLAQYVPAVRVYSEHHFTAVDPADGDATPVSADDFYGAEGAVTFSSGIVVPETGTYVVSMFLKAGAAVTNETYMFATPDTSLDTGHTPYATIPAGGKQSNTASFTVRLNAGDSISCALGGTSETIADLWADVDLILIAP